MNFLTDVITYLRRIVKTPSDAVLSDNLIIDYINRFWIMDVDARMQLFDLKTKYQFQTTVGICNYNMPLYNLQTEQGDQEIASYPMYQGFMNPCFCNGVNVPFYTDSTSYYNMWPSYLQQLQIVGEGDGVTTTFQFQLPSFPAIPGYLDMSGVMEISSGGVTEDPIFTNQFTLNSNNFIAAPSASFYPGVYLTYTNSNGSNTIITDSGIFLSTASDSDLYGLLMQPGRAPFGNLPIGGNAYSMTANTVNYNTGVINVTFPIAPPSGAQIQAQSYFFQQGMPRSVLFSNNCIRINPPPNTQYLMELTAYLTPAAFLSSDQALPFAYMAEYLARGAARKILADTGDVEQFQFYEPLFKEQETLVWKRSQRQFTSTRTPSLFSDMQWQNFSNNFGQGVV